MVTKAITVASGRGVSRTVRETKIGSDFSRSLSLPKAKNSTAGLMLINEQLDIDTVQAIADSQRFVYAIQHCEEYLGEAEREVRHGFCERAKPLHASWLTSLPRAVHAYHFLDEIVGCPGVAPLIMLTHADATSMLHYLFGAMGKRRGDEAAAKLNACADIFNPTSNALAQALGLWKPAPTHPVILAVAIKQLMAEKTFEPAESELREALGKVEQRLKAHRSYVYQWLEKLERADEIVFRFDRPAWDRAYANVDSEVPLQMRGRLFEDDDDEQSPRWKALNDLWEQKLEQEEPGALADQTTNRAGNSTVARVTPAIAACAKPAAKKTKKLANA